jgi:hypothetical protein
MESVTVLHGHPQFPSPRIGSRTGLQEPFLRQLFGRVANRKCRCDPTHMNCDGAKGKLLNYSKRVAGILPGPRRSYNGRARSTNLTRPLIRSYQARSCSSVAPSPRAQCTQQKIWPFFSTPCPTIRHPQCGHFGARAWIAHSKLSNTCVFPARVTSKVLS